MLHEKNSSRVDLLCLSAMPLMGGVVEVKLQLFFSKKLYICPFQPHPSLILCILKFPSLHYLHCVLVEGCLPCS